MYFFKHQSKYEKSTGGGRKQVKIKLRLALFLLFVLILFPALLFSMENIRQKDEGSFIFPAALEEVGEEAFAGTAVKTLIFPKGLRYIGNDAFEDTEALTDAYIPETAEAIEDDAFPENEGLTIHGIGGSKAEKWAREHRVSFVSADIWTLRVIREKPFDVKRIALKQAIRISNPLKSIKLNERTKDEGSSMRPQERAELNRIDYRFP